MKIIGRSIVRTFALGFLICIAPRVNAAPTCSGSSTVETVRQLVIQVYPGHPTNQQEAALNQIDPVLSDIRTVPRADGVRLCRASLVIHIFRKGGQRFIGPKDYHGDQTLGNGTISYSVEVTDDGKPYVTLLRDNP